MNHQDRNSSKRKGFAGIIKRSEDYMNPE